MFFRNTRHNYFAYIRATTFEIDRAMIKMDTHIIKIFGENTLRDVLNVIAVIKADPMFPYLAGAFFVKYMFVFC